MTPSETKRENEYEDPRITVRGLEKPLIGMCYSYRQGVYSFAAEKSVTYLRGCKELDQKMRKAFSYLRTEKLNNFLPSKGYYFEFTIAYKGAVLSRDKATIRKHLVDVQLTLFKDEKLIRTIQF